MQTGAGKAVRGRTAHNVHNARKQPNQLIAAASVMKPSHKRGACCNGIISTSALQIRSTPVHRNIHTSLTKRVHEQLLTYVHDQASTLPVKVP